MRRTTLVLAREHAYLARTIAWFERLLHSAERQDEIDAVAVSTILGFFEDTVDGLHQDKEELVLFPKLLNNAPPEFAASVRELLHHHEDDRRRLEMMRSTLEGAAYGHGLSLDAFLVHAWAYVKLQREHMEHENRLLLPLIEETFSRAEDAEVVSGFRRLEERRGSSFTSSARSLISQLERQAIVLAA